MPKFNIICHGMMLFVDEGQEIRILMPRIDEHEYAFGAPQFDAAVRHCLPYPFPLPLGEFTLTGPRKLPQPAPLINYVDSNAHLVLRKTSFDVVADDALFRLWIPKPAEAVLLYRSVTLGSHNPLGAGTPPAVAIKPNPAKIHDIVVFSYDVGPGTEVSIGRWYKETITSNGLNLCLYCQTGRTSTNAALLAQHLILGTSAPPHPTGLNDILRLKSGGKKPTLELSRVGTAGDPIDDPYNGISKCQLKSLVELAYPHHFDPDRTDPGGCAGTFLSEE